MVNIFWDVSLAVLVAALCGILAHLLRQPAIIGYLVAGILLGPMAFGLITDADTIVLLSELGVAFLLFIVGLELDIRKVRSLGAVALITGIGQVVFTSLVGYYLLAWAGMDATSALVLSFGLTLSSTVLVIKLLSDKNQINTLHGRIVLGILIIQDFIAVVGIALLSGAGTVDPSTLMLLGLKGAVLFTATVALGLTILPQLFRFISRSQELLLIGAVAWCLLAAVGAQMLNFSPAIGALLAGMSLASLPYRYEITGRVRILRDFFAMIFFVSLGMQITFALDLHTLSQVATLCLFVLVGNPLIVLLIMAVAGFKPHTGFISGLYIAQVSEFSLIFVQLAAMLGLVGASIVSQTVLVLAITFAVSSLFITHAEILYSFFEPLLQWTKWLSLRKKNWEHAGSVPHRYAPDVILVGANRIGRSVIDKAVSLKKKLLIIDFDPKTIQRLMKQHIPCMYGDGGDPDILNHVDLSKTQVVISTSNSLETNTRMLEYIKKTNKSLPFVCVAEHPSEGLYLYGEGADGVIVPHLLGGGKAAALLLKSLRSKSRLQSAKRAHLRDIGRWMKETYGR